MIRTQGTPHAQSAIEARLRKGAPRTLSRYRVQIGISGTERGRGAD